MAEDKLKDLKSRAYDLLSLIERANQELRQVNQKIQEENAKQQPKKEKEVKKSG